MKLQTTLRGLTPSGSLTKLNDMPLLTVTNLSVNYGAIEALRGVSLVVNEGEIVTLIGGNGAGKTTLLKTISGLLSPRDGEITFAGKPITDAPPHRTVEAGLLQVPEGRGIFANLTVEENFNSAPIPAGTPPRSAPIATAC